MHVHRHRISFHIRKDKHICIQRQAHTMPTHSNNLNQCSFIGYKGLCGRRCYRDVCSVHIDKKPMTLCKHCGIKGTTTPHGFCASLASGCLWKAHYASRLLKAAREELLALDLGSSSDGKPVQAQTVVPTTEVAQKVDRAVATAQLQRALSEATLALSALEDNFET